MAPGALPNVSWISQARWDALSDADKRGLAKICPDFVLELRSPMKHLAASYEVFH
jgi:Uma2 family endonuclease